MNSSRGRQIIAEGVVGGSGSLIVADEVDLVVVVGGVSPELGGRDRVGQFQLNRLARDQRHAVGGRNISTALVTSSGVVIPRLKDQRPGVAFVGRLDRGPRGRDADGARDSHISPFEIFGSDEYSWNESSEINSGDRQSEPSMEGFHRKTGSNKSPRWL